MLSPSILTYTIRNMTVDRTLRFAPLGLSPVCYANTDGSCTFGHKVYILIFWCYSLINSTARGRMVLYFGCGLLLLMLLGLPGLSLGDLVFHCPKCTAERQTACPELTINCTEIVREPACGCCPVCARLEGEFCGVYTPRCSTGLRCYPTTDSDLPLEQLVQGLGRCSHKVDPVPILTQEHQDKSGK